MKASMVASSKHGWMNVSKTGWYHVRVGIWSPVRFAHRRKADAYLQEKGYAVRGKKIVKIEDDSEEIQATFADGLRAKGGARPPR